MAYSVVAIGTSWGGLAALTKLLGDLPMDFGIPVVVVQHRSKDSERLLVQLLQDATDMKSLAQFNTAAPRTMIRLL